MSTSSLTNPQQIEIGVLEEVASIPISMKHLDDTNDKEFAIKLEKANMEELSVAPDQPYLYPNLDDPKFNIKIAERKEFNDTQYDGAIKDVEMEAGRLCNADFELAPHQLFVRNFLSFTTPYNSLLLYHGLGSGKTCSAIGVGEEMRAYLKQMGINQRIIVVASPNVQDNFRLQLFDERKLKLVDGLWNIKACTGNSLLKEINPMSMRGLSKDRIVRQVKRIINNSYLFLGYIEFANYISKISDVSDIETGDANEIRNRKLRRYFNNRLVIIDEVHNIRITDENKDKKVAVEVLRMVKVVSGLRLLMLSATPMYNSYKEIVWLINLMNINDRRPPVELKQIFDKNGNFVVDKEGVEVGRELLERKATGYISFVRGENPYGFPYRIYPVLFDKENTLENQEYPDIQLNGKRIIQGVSHLGLYSIPIGEYQVKGYQFIMNTIREGVKEGKPPYREMPNFENMESFGYTMLQRPLEALNIVYPDSKLDKAIAGEKTDLEPKNIVGKGGLTRIFKYKESAGLKKDFEYRLKQYNGIMGPTEIGKYSAKIESIVKNAVSSEGIILVYSQYIDGGLIPIALALEELGYTRYVSKGGKSRSLFKKAPTEPIDALSFESRDTFTGEKFKPARYAMITGDKSISPNNIEEIKALTNESNVNGEQVKIVLISQAGSEGLDFTAIRQVHVLEPWYNMNRIEQIIGRAVRWCSHKALPFTKRNVEIFLYSTRLGEEEAADLYVYRLAEMKAIQIGRVSRVLKESAVDCLLNDGQRNFTIQGLNQTVKQILSSGETIDYQVGDRPYTATCDYMESCDFTCSPDANIESNNVKLDTFSEAFIMMNTDKIIQRLRQLYREKFFYTKQELIGLINSVRQYPLVQIDAALTQLIEDKNEYITDMYGRLGNLVNKGDLYLFQPIELQDENVPLFERMVPIQYKNDFVQIPLIGDIKNETEEAVVDKVDMSVLEQIESDFDMVLLSKEPARGEDNWYVFASQVVDNMVEEGYTNKSELEKQVIAHAIEMLNYQVQSKLVEYIYSDYERALDKAPRTAKLIKEYFESKLIQTGNLVAMPLYKNNAFSLLIKNSDNTFREAQAEDYADFKSELDSIKSKVNNLSDLVGFISTFKNDYMVFKTKQMSKKRHKGARCDQSGKSEALRVLNMILEGTGRMEYTAENTKSISQKSICVRQELVLRVFNKEAYTDKVWFMTAAEAALVELEKL